MIISFEMKLLCTEEVERSSLDRDLVQGAGLRGVRLGRLVGGRLEVDRSEREWIEQLLQEELGNHREHELAHGPLRAIEREQHVLHEALEQLLQLVLKTRNFDHTPKDRTHKGC